MTRILCAVTLGDYGITGRQESAIYILRAMPTLRTQTVAA